jgi:hypothetical protein
MWEATNSAGPELVAQNSKWIDKDGKLRTLAELNEVKWAFDAINGVRAVLRSADFREVDLTGLDLSYTDLSGAKFESANLTKVGFVGANFEKASAGGSEASTADFDGAQLDGAHFTLTDLEGASFMSADLRGGIIDYSNLRGANFQLTDLTGASLACSDLSGALYEPSENPDPQSMVTVNGLDTLIFDRNSAPIIALRKSLRDAGFNRQANLVGASYRKHGELPIESILFDWTCNWGADWTRPLWLLCLLCFVCAPLYWLGLHFSRRDGLYVISSGQRVVTSRGKERWRRVYVVRTRSLNKSQRRVIGPLPAPRWKTWRMSLKLWMARWVWAELTALKTAFLFSVMSALNLGFHDFSFGRWIKMLQPREFDLRARGWMRVASGVQSLLGLYLVALSLLSYFGHPFE